ncbi:uncharacterized protein LOC129757501 [Uranotaenia lowii]|uniref:uncharacterized protein LOC129757501 n=1 Tax=Uranotaenia lowii TaxID=190385 RepID=UPI0024788AAE|nr:uncharacterized protein LOC129757501 [Uranotaenia lowii]
MITHWNLVLVLGMFTVLSPAALARQADSYTPPELAVGPRAELPAAEELYSDLVDEVQKLHNQEINYLQYLATLANRQQRQEDLLQQQQAVLEELQEKQQVAAHRHQQQKQLLTGDAADESLVDLLNEIPADSGANKNLNRLARLHEQLPKQQLPYQTKAKDEKKDRPYMSLCHFKLCNMGRKRNTRFLHFWN